MLDPQNPEHRPPYVEFVTRAVEDRTKEWNELGMYGVKDVIIAKITRPGQRDTVERLAEEWVVDLHKQANDGRIPREWATQFGRALEAFRNGQELPLDGTPIRGWNLLTPAQQETVIRAGIRTVEDLAALNQEGIGKIGMGGITWKNAAQAWLQQGRDKGAVAAEVADLKRDNEALKEELAKRDEQMQDILRQLGELKGAKATL